MSYTVRAFSGATVEQVESQARAELGADVRIVDRRVRLEGGIGGFFQRQVVEILAVGGLDDGTDVPPTPDADEFDFERALIDLAPEPEAAAAMPASDGASAAPADAHAALRLLAEQLLGRGAGADVALELLRTGVDAALAAELLEEAGRHRRVFAPGADGRELVRLALARRVRTASLGRLLGRGAVVVAGTRDSGKSVLAAKIVRALAAAAQPVAAVAIGPQRNAGVELLRETARSCGAGFERLGDLGRPLSESIRDGDPFVVVDAPALDPEEERSAAGLREVRAAVGGARTLVAIAADAHAPAPVAAARAWRRLADALAVTRFDVASGAGVLANVGAGQAKPLAFASSDGDSLVPLDPQALARLVLP